MNESKLLTVKLSYQDYNRLTKEAQRLNLPISILAQRLLKFSLEEIPPQFDKQKAREAIAGLREIGKNLSLIDGVAIARESREELEQRFIF
ncbi:MAG: hypothetical protein F6K22_35065 [Okeania sp. SIO2F4]|uniref:hypothetical protein n=1 Tax=Okeania sp. SIO2F4 TaxID=2607790 RepID=UPI00142BABF5|nr:hypothetical protein [Okeania sp. SIO2F4]NES07551.1 hypothetical protein [Okeania sp. SIO2F4]